MTADHSTPEHRTTLPLAPDGSPPGQPWRERLLESLWRTIGQSLMRLTFHNWYGVRRRLLACFGARIHPTARVRPSVKISHPWNLSVGAHSAIGDHAILLSRAPITIGRRCTISQYSHLCTVTYDYTMGTMPLIMRPITIEDDVWLAADVFVGPGVHIGRDTLVGARSTVMHSLPAGMICAGDNARPLRPRQVRPPHGPAASVLPVP